MEIINYANQKKYLYDKLMSYIECETFDDEKINNLKNIIISQKILNDKEEFRLFLHLISSISANHHRDTYFIQKIERILSEYEINIKQTFSKIEIINIFKKDIKILHFLMNKQIIIIDKSNINYLLESDQGKVPGYCHFFLPEIKKFISIEKVEQIEKEISTIEMDNFDYNKKRLEGENQDFICSLIRQDLLNDFISFINTKNISISSEIKPSIYETNLFLIDKTPTLIEYASFFGSIKIFKYLLVNHAYLNPELWLYGIHSNNPEIIHILEDNHNKIDNKMLIQIYKESIKCHHNNIAFYIENNLLNQEIDKKSNIFLKCIFKYHNYLFFPEVFDQNCIFFYLNKYNYLKIVGFLIKKKKKQIKSYIKIHNRISSHFIYIFLIIFYNHFFKKKFQMYYLTTRLFNKQQKIIIYMLFIIYYQNKTRLEKNFLKNVKN